MGMMNWLVGGKRSAAVATPPAGDGPSVTADPAREGMLTRAVRVDTGRMDTTARTLPAILSTEGRVLVYDWRSGEVIEEVLVAGGGTYPERMPLLDSHSRYTSRSVLGSVRDIRVDGDKIRGTVHFGRNLGDDVDQIWNRIAEGHLTDGSIGYRYGGEDYIDIKPGRSATVEGREWTAEKNTLRVVSRWRMHEYSVTPIGADEAAKLNRGQAGPGRLVASGGVNLGSPEAGSEESGGNSREAANDRRRGVDNSDSRSGSDSMKHLRRFLVWLGLREDATDEQLRSFREMLGGDNAERAARIERGEEEFDPAQEPARGQTQTEHRGSGTTPDRAPGTGDTATSQPGAPSPTAGADGGRGQGETGGETEGQRAVRIERERVAFANDYRSQVGDEVAQRAITEGWDQGRMQAEFLKHLRDNRSKPLTGTTGVHMVDRSVTRQALQVAMLERSGFGLDNDLLGVSQVAHAISDRQSNAAWLVAAHRAHRAGGRLTDEASRAMDAASRFRGISLRDICAEALSMEGTRFDRYDVTEMWRYALSSASVADIFTTHFAVQFMQGFMGIPDTTVGWTRESDLPNLQKVERKQMGKSTALKKRVRGQTADHMTIDAIGEEYRLAEYAGQFFVDMQDVIDDRFGSLDVMPSEMGEAAMEIRPDLVYAILLSNPSLGRDNTALFHADHGNLHADRTLTGDDLAFARSKMSTQKKGDRLIGVTPRGLIVPDSKDHTAWELVNSADKRDNTDGKVYGVRNWAAGRFNVVSEPRLDVGVVDPDSGDFVAGQPDAQFLTAEGGRHGIEVGFLQGTGRRPTMRRFTADEGRFGMGWDIQHFVGAKALGYEGLAKMVDPAG